MIRAVRNAKARARYALNRAAQVERAAKWARENKGKVNAASVARRQKKPIEFVLYWNARNRAKAKAIPFNLQISDIKVPKFCPVLGLELVVGLGHARPNSPSLDRINPELGYVKGNIAVLSHKANTIKNNATINDLERVLAFMKAAQ